MKKIFKIQGMHCPSCVMNIEGELEDIGVKAICSYHKQAVTVNYDPTHVSEEAIKQAVVRAGYSIRD